VISNHLPKVAIIDPHLADLDRRPWRLEYANARVLFLTDRLAEAEDLLRHILEEHPRRQRSWPLLVEGILAKGHREGGLCPTPLLFTLTLLL